MKDFTKPQASDNQPNSAGSAGKPTKQLNKAYLALDTIGTIFIVLGVLSIFNPEQLSFLPSWVTNQGAIWIVIGALLSIPFWFDLIKSKRNA